MSPVDLPASTRSRSSGRTSPSTSPSRPTSASPSATIRSRATSLAGALDAATGGNKDERIFLRADRTVPYGDVMQVMNDLRAAGYLKVALVGLEMREAK